MSPDEIGSLGAYFEIPESTIAEIGEEQAWEIARRGGERAAQRAAAERSRQIGRTVTVEKIAEEDLPQNFPTIDPETGAEIPPRRLYRFRYRATAA